MLNFHGVCPILTHSDFDYYISMESLVAFTFHSDVSKV